MNINIIDNYYIKSDRFQYRLVEVCSKAGKDSDEKKLDEEYIKEEDTYEVTRGYFPTIELLLNSLIDTKIKENDCTTLVEFVNHISDIKMEIQQMLDTIVNQIGEEIDINDFLKTKVKHEAEVEEEPEEKPKRTRKSTTKTTETKTKKKTTKSK